MEPHRLYDQNIDYNDTYRTDPSSFVANFLKNN
jgi:hypothetical protein